MAFAAGYLFVLAPSLLLAASAWSDSSPALAFIGLILVAPLLMPLAQAIGLHPIQYAAIFCVNLAIGSLTPPYASLLYLGMRIGKVEFMDMLPPTLLFLAGYVPVMLLTTYWPALSLTLPRMLGYM